MAVERERVAQCVMHAGDFFLPATTELRVLRIHEEIGEMRELISSVLLMLVLAFVGCSAGDHHTDKRKLMASMNFDPSKCEQIGPTVMQCGGEHSLAGSGDSYSKEMSSDNTSWVRGVCAAGSHYVEGSGCQKDK